MALIIRPATPADIPQLLSLIAEHAAFEGASFAADAKFTERLAAAAFCAEPRVQLWLAADGEKLIGYAAASREFSTWSAAEYLHLDCLYVREARRGRGLGGQLLDRVIEAACKVGLVEMQWQTPAWNRRAIDFYRGRGAKALEKQRFFLAISAATDNPCISQIPQQVDR